MYRFVDSQRVGGTSIGWGGGGGRTSFTHVELKVNPLYTLSQQHVAKYKLEAWLLQSVN